MTRNAWIFWGVFVAAAAFRFVTALYRAPPDASTCLHNASVGVGMVSADPVINATGQILVIEADSISVGASECAHSLAVRVKAKPYPRFSYGDKVGFSGKLLPPIDFAGDNGRSFDFKGYLAKDGIYYQMQSAKVWIATSSDGPPGASGSSGASLGMGWLRGALYSMKRRFVANLDSSLCEPEASFAAGLVVGEKTGLGSEVLNDFRIVGLIHVVILAGFHVAIVGIALRRALSFLPRTWGIVAGIAAVSLFCVMVGAGATVVRACIMAVAALFADLVRRDYSAFRALLFAALVMIIAQPLVAIDDMSFQLSFLATLGLIMFGRPIEARLGFVTERFELRRCVTASIATQISVAPYILYAMGQLSIIGVPANILVLPFIPLTMLAVFLTGALGFVHPMPSVAAGWGAHVLLAYELWVVQELAKFPFAALYFPPFSIWWVVAMYAAIFGGLSIRKLPKLLQHFAHVVR